MAAARGGISFAAPADYYLRGTRISEAYEALRMAGFHRLSWFGAAPGDVLLGVPANRQVHFAVRTPTGVIEAHIGLRRVIERPMASDEQWDCAWRFPPC